MNKPTDSVRIVLFDGQNPEKFLVLTEADDPENWKLPGGRFTDEHESPEAAAARELEEEVGLDAYETGLRVSETLVNNDGHSKRYIFSGKTASDSVRPSDEISQTGWFTKDTLPESKNRGHILSAVASARASLAASDK